MNQAATPDRVEIRTSLDQVVAGVVVFAALGSGLSFCAPFDAGPPVDPENAWVITGVVLVISLAIVAGAFTNRAPRMILDAIGISWREGRHKIYEQLPWPEVLFATIEPGGEDEVKRLRLHLRPRPALERVASEGVPRWVDISLDTVDIHDRRLRRVINQRAPHLFTGAARDRLDLTAP